MTTIEEAARNYIANVKGCEIVEEARRVFVRNNPCLRPVSVDGHDFRDAAPCYSSVGIVLMGEPICENCKAALKLYEEKKRANRRKGRAHATLRQAVERTQ